MGMFTSINIASTGMAAERLRSDVISNNIANDSTPNYKRQDVQFESILQAALATGGDNLDEMVNKVNMNLDDLDSYIYTDRSSLSYRLDGNNVDIDQEEAYLAENQIRYQALVDLMTQEFSRYKTVLS